MLSVDVILFQTLYIYKESIRFKLSTTTMKFTPAIAALFAALTTTCSAQRVKIGFPANGTSVSPGSKLVVQVVQKVSLFLAGLLPNRNDIDFIVHSSMDTDHSAWCCDWTILMHHNKFSLPSSWPSIGNHSL